MTSRNVRTLTVLLTCFLNQPALAAVSLVEKGCDQINNGNYSSAIVTLSQAVRSNPSDLDARRYLCSALLKNGNAKAASQQLEAIIKFAPGNNSDLCMLGEAYVQCGESQNAVSTYKQAVRNAPASSQARRGLARALVAAGDFVTAKSVISETLRTSSDAQLRNDCIELLGVIKQRSQVATNTGNS